MLDLAQVIRDCSADLRVLNLGIGGADTSTPMGQCSSRLGRRWQLEHDIKRERIVDSIHKRREDGEVLGWRPRRQSPTAGEEVPFTWCEAVSRLQS